MGKFTLKKSLKRYTANVLNFLLLFSLIVPNVLSPAIVIAQDLDIEQEESITEIPTIPIDESEDILEEGISTSTFEEGIYTVSLVEEKEYVYPEDDRVRIRFTSITEEGDLTIKKVILTEEEKLSLNTTDEYAWDFTSTMSNGSFTYDLVLPNNQGEEIEVKYSEDGSTYSPIEEVLVNEGIVKISGLDHFTTFVVVPAGTIPGEVAEGTTQVDSTCNVSSGSGMFCYDTIQEAINAAQANGNTEQDIINIQNGTYNECLNITGENIKLLGESKNGVIIDNSSCSSYGIHIHEADQIEFKTMTIKGSLSSYTFKIAHSTNIELRNIIVKDSYRTAIDLNGVNNAFLNSIEAKNTTQGFGLMIKDSNNIEVGNVKTENNMWGGVSVQTEGYPYPAGSDNVRFTGTFDAEEEIPLLIEEDPHRNTGDYTEITNLQVPSQFQYIVYTLREEDDYKYKQWFYNETLENAKAYAKYLISSPSPTYTDILIFDVAEENYWTIPGMLIQDAIDDSTDNDVINITEGTYEEQLSIDSKSLTLQGDGKDKTFINSPDKLETLYETSDNNKPIVYFHNSDSIIKDLTVDGLGKGNANYRMMGISFYNAGGEVKNVEIKNIQDTPASGAQHGIGLYVYVDNGGPKLLNVDNVNIHDYQKNGIAFNGEGLIANISNSTIKGLGEINFNAQNGIQYGFGATGTAEGNNISDNFYTPSDWSAAGILAYAAGEGLIIKNNYIFNNEIGLDFSAGSFGNALIKGNTVKNNDYGIWLDKDISPTVQITENIFDNKEENAADGGAYYYDNGVKGNYWSDYTGIDLNGDGIGETPYDIDEDSSDKYPLTTQYLSATVNYVDAHKQYYKEGDVLSIDVEVTNNGSIPLEPTKEQLVINITNPSGTYISGTFRGKALLDLQPGETKTYKFYTTEQTIPDTWVDGTYRIHSSIYSQRTSPLNYLMGGQNHSETFIVDSTKPFAPKLLSPIDNYFTNQTSVIQTWTSTDTDIDYYEYESCSNDPDSEGFCTHIYSTTTENTSRTVNNNNITFWWRVRAIDFAGNVGDWSEARKITIDTTKPSTPEFFAPDDNLFTNINFIKLEWTGGDDTGSGVKGYILGYTFTPANGGTDKNWNTGLREVGNPYWHSGTYGHGEGKYVFWVKTVDYAGNESETSELLTVTYDKTAPVAPSIVFPSEGQYFNSTPILNDWTDVSDPSGIKEYRIEYIYDDGHTFSGAPYRTTVLSQRNHIPNLSEQGGVTIRVRAIDNVGNEGAWSNPVHYYYDATPPELPELLAPDNMSLVKGAVLTNSWSDISDADYYEYESYHNESLTNLRWYQEVNGTSKTAYNVAESTFWWRVRAVDLAGNKSAWTDAWKVTIDNTSPTTEQLADFSIDEGSTIPTKEVLVEDNYELDEFCYSITSGIGDMPETCINPVGSTDSWDVNLSDTILTELSNKYGITTSVANTSIIPEGDYSISYFAKDKAGNESTLHTFIVTIKNVVPTVLFSSSTTELLEGNSVSFNGSFTDPGLDDSNWTFTLSFGDGTTDVIGTLTAPGNIFSNYSHTYTDAGDYTASLEVCEDGGLICTTDTIDITVGEVQGVTTGNSTTTKKPTTLVKKVTTYIADILGVGGEGDVLALEEDEETLEDDEEVKGSQTCDNPSTISGYIYIDSNENGEKDEGERAFPEISIRIYTITEGMEETVKQIVSDENGYWETTLCSGDYYISVDDSKLPNNYVLEEDTLGVQVEEDKDSTLNFEVLDERNFLQKYWPWILLAVGILGSIGIVAVDTRRKKEYI